jgi:integrase
MVGLRLGYSALSGSRTPHLQRRNGIFHLRVRVPQELRLRIGLREVRRSLHTYSGTKARLLVAIYVPRLRRTFDMLETGNVTREHVQSRIRNCFTDLKRTVDDGYCPTTSYPEFEVAEQAGLAREFIRELQCSVASRAFPPSLILSATDLCASWGWPFESLPEPRQHDVLEGLARALIEQQSLYLFRLRDRLLSYTPCDPLFVGEVNCTALFSRVGDRTGDVPVGPTMADAIAAYLKQGTEKWTAKTHAGRTRQMRYVQDHFGCDTLLTDVTPHHVRTYRDAIKRLRSNHHRTGGRTFSQRQTQNEQHRISAKTAVLMFETVKAFFRWCTATEGFISTNPAENVRIEGPKKAKGLKSRRPFSAPELTTLFSQPLFTGCASVKRRFVTGSIIIRDDYFWIPILGFYTGARLGEIVQLHLGDVALGGAIPFIEISEAGGNEPGSANAKHVKSAAGIRHVPLHPDILELGFADFVASRGKHRKATDRLFHRIRFGSDGQASTVFSKWFARFLDKAGLSDSALVFHSFRHNAEDALRDALQPQYVIDRIIGHFDGATSSQYGDGVSLATAYAAVKAMHLQVRLPELW